MTSWIPHSERDRYWSHVPTRQAHMFISLSLSPYLSLSNRQLHESKCSVPGTNSLSYQLHPSVSFDPWTRKSLIKYLQVHRDFVEILIYLRVIIFERRCRVFFVGAIFELSCFGGAIKWVVIYLIYEIRRVWLTHYVLYREIK